MQSLSKNISQRPRLIVFALLVYMVMVVFGVTSLVLKRDALAFHPRDYNYFIEQAARLSDPLMSKRFAMNIEGFNFIGLQGIEGARSLTQAIHAEYFRYTYTALFAIFHSTLPIYIFYSLIFFLPIPYIALVAAPKTGIHWKAAVLFILLFALFPATIPSLTAELRSRMLFAAAWCLLVLAIYTRRPFLEKLILFGFLLSLREEGVLLGAILIALNYIYLPAGVDRRNQTLVLIGLDVLGLAAFLAFMVWGGYTRIDAGMNPLTFLYELLIGYPGLVAAAGALLALAVGLAWRKGWLRRRQVWLLLVYSLAMALSGLQALRDILQFSTARPAASTADLITHTLTSSLTGLFFYISLLLLVLLLNELHGRARKILMGSLVGLCLVSAGATAVTLQPQVKAWWQAIPPARVVWQFVNSHDRYQTGVLLDESTYQAFYDFDQVLVYTRLPLWLVNPVLENRYYPQNTSLLVPQIQQRLEYAVISRGSESDVRELARQAGVPVEEVAGNAQFVILHLR